MRESELRNSNNTNTRMNKMKDEGELLLLVRAETNGTKGRE